MISAIRKSNLKELLCCYLIDYLFYRSYKLYSSIPNKILLSIS